MQIDNKDETTSLELNVLTSNKRKACFRLDPGQE